jgi:MraZ protein
LFNGEYNHTIDPKGRLIIPSKFREGLGDQFKITRGLDGCLFLFPMNEWHSYEEKLKNLPLADKNARKFSRFFTAGATTCEVDKQGRVLIPSTLREFAKIEKEVIFAGLLNRIELWSKEQYDEVNSYDDMDEIAEQLGVNLGFSI